MYKADDAYIFINLGGGGGFGSKSPIKLYDILGIPWPGAIIIYERRLDWNCFSPKAMSIVFVSPAGYFFKCQWLS